MNTLLIIGILTAGYGDRFVPIHAVQFETEAQCMAEKAKYPNQSKYEKWAYCVPLIQRNPK